MAESSDLPLLPHYCHYYRHYHDYYNYTCLCMRVKLQDNLELDEGHQGEEFPDTPQAMLIPSAS